MNNKIMKVVDEYEKSINDGIIVGTKCDECNEIFVPPRPICLLCGITMKTFEKIETEGKILTWTIIHIAPPTHLEKVPYTLAIVELKNGQKLTGILNETNNEKINFGDKVFASFDLLLVQSHTELMVVDCLVMISHHLIVLLARNTFVHVLMH